MDVFVYEQVRLLCFIELQCSVVPEGRVEKSPGQAKRSPGKAKSRDETALEGQCEMVAL